jgi:hypothetical protein
VSLTRIPNIPYYPAAPKVAAVTQRLAFPPQLIVVHDTGNPTANAQQEAHNAANRTDPQPDWTAAHAYVDEDGPLGSLDLDLAAWSAYHFANLHGWHVEMCGMDAGDPNAVPALTIANTANLVRELAALGGQTIQHVGPAGVAAIAAGDTRLTGICGHRDITLAGIDSNDHSDPGSDFDWGHFIGLVGAKTTTTKEEDMYLPVPEGVAFHDDAGSTWADMTKALALPVPRVGPADYNTGAWGPRWVWLAGNQKSVVRLVYNGGGWGGQDVHLLPADGGQVVGLPNGTTEVFIGYKSGSGAVFMIKGSL